MPGAADIMSSRSGGAPAQPTQVKPGSKAGLWSALRPMFWKQSEQENPVSAFVSAAAPVGEFDVVTRGGDYFRMFRMSGLVFEGAEASRIEEQHRALSSFGLQTSGYTATLGDREAVKSEQQRLSQASRDRETHTRAHQQTPRPEDSLAQATQSSSDRSPGKGRQAPLDAAITKAMHESRVPPALQARLREMIATEALRRQATAPQWRAEVYDPKAPRARPGSKLSTGTEKRDRQRDR